MTLATATSASSLDRGLETSPVLVHFCGGNKGGVGKSFFCRRLYSYLKAQGVSVQGVEADSQSPDFYGIYKDEVDVIEFSENEAKSDAPNLLLDLSCEDRHSVVVNLPGHVHEALTGWLTSYDALSLMSKHSVKPVHWFITSGQYDSIQSLVRSLNDLGETMPHVIVCNLMFSEWDYFETHSKLQALIAQHNVPVIELPKLPGRISDVMLNERLTLEQATTYRNREQRYGIGEQSSVLGFMKSSAAQIQKALELLS